MSNYKRIAYLTEDTTLSRDSIRLHYRRRGVIAGFSGPPATVCPPVEKLKKGTRVQLKFNCGEVLKVELVSV